MILSFKNVLNSLGGCISWEEMAKSPFLKTSIKLRRDSIRLGATKCLKWWYIHWQWYTLEYESARSAIILYDLSIEIYSSEVLVCTLYSI